ncbi:hypothetical protein FrEUN1fDRAFT_4382 [Parafrankia sp. EUN1f]|nr:hypothetical protein FrEUN1fDRAFT_4382 [Parafrankia sp. EUN1f]
MRQNPPARAGGETPAPVPVTCPATPANGQLATRGQHRSIVMERERTKTRRHSAVHGENPPAARMNPGRPAGQRAGNPGHRSSLEASAAKHGTPNNQVQEITQSSHGRSKMTLRKRRATSKEDARGYHQSGRSAKSSEDRGLTADDVTPRGQGPPSDVRSAAHGRQVGSPRTRRPTHRQHTEFSANRQRGPAAVCHSDSPPPRHHHTKSSTHNPAHLPPAPRQTRPGQPAVPESGPPHANPRLTGPKSSRIPPIPNTPCPVPSAGIAPRGRPHGGRGEEQPNRHVRGRCSHLREQRHGAGVVGPFQKGKRAGEPA